MAESPINAALFDVGIPEASEAPVNDLPADDYTMTELAVRRLCDQLNARLRWHGAYPYHRDGQADMSLLRQGWVVHIFPLQVPGEHCAVTEPMSCEDIEVFARNLEGGE